MKKTIKLLRDLIKDTNCDRMNRSTIKGYLGELIVKNKLENEGVKVLHKGNQSGYDLEFKHKNTTFKIDVKLSTLKMEQGQEVWGWALLHENKSKSISCSHFICVALDKQFIEKYFFIISAKDTKQFPQGIGQFSKVKHGFMYLPTVHRTSNQSHSAIIQSYKLLSKNIVCKIKPNENILKHLTNQYS